MSSRASNEGGTGGASNEIVPVKINSNDVGYRYGTVMDPTKKGQITCSFCQRVIPGGISRFKQHIVNQRGQTKGCDKAPMLVQKEVQKAMDEEDEDETWEEGGEDGDCDNEENEVEVEVNEDY